MDSIYMNSQGFEGSFVPGTHRIFRPVDFGISFDFITYLITVFMVDGDGGRPRTLGSWFTLHYPLRHP